MKKLHVIALLLTICTTAHPDQTIQDALNTAPAPLTSAEGREGYKEEAMSSTKSKVGISAKEIICFGFLAGCTALLLLDAYTERQISKTKAKNPLWFLGIKTSRS